MIFQAWKLKYFNSMIFQVFHDLYEPCLFFVSSASPSSERRADAQAWLVFTSDASTNTYNFKHKSAYFIVKTGLTQAQGSKYFHFLVLALLHACVRLRCVKTKHSTSTRNLLRLANWSTCSRFPASEHLNKMADSAVDF